VAADMADMADMAVMADTADIMADTADILARCRREADTADTADILARYRREADTSSAEAGRHSAAAHREHTATGVAATGAAAIGAAIGGVIIDPPATDSSLSADLVIRTTGIGTHIGAGAILTRTTRTTAIILIGIILRIGTTIAPYQEGNSFGTDPSVRFRAYERSYVALSWQRANN
jgi:hypothetical protein